MPATNAFQNATARARYVGPRRPAPGLLTLAAHRAMCPEARARNRAAFEAGEGGFTADLAAHLTAERRQTEADAYLATAFACSERERP